MDAVFADLAGDPWPDLVLINRWNKGHALFEALPDGRYRDVTRSVGFGAGYPQGQGAAAADWDGDGDADLAVTQFIAETRLFRRDDGRLVDVTDDSGVRIVSGEERVASGDEVFPADLDADGRLDLVQATLGQVPAVWINEGAWRFRDVGPWTRLGAVEAVSLTALDMELDGDLDFYAAVAGQPNHLLENTRVEGVTGAVQVRRGGRVPAGLSVRVAGIDAGGAHAAVVPASGLPVALTAGPAGETALEVVDPRTGELLGHGTLRPGALAVIDLDPGLSGAAQRGRQALTTRLRWMHADEELLRLVAMVLALGLVFALGRRQRAERWVTRWWFPLAWLAGFVAVAVAAGEGHAAIRWGLGLALIAGPLALLPLDVRSSRDQRARHVAHFRLEERIGQGGMGTVWKARDLVHRRTVALKILHADAVAETQDRERFRREAAVGASLTFPHIVRIWEWGECQVFEGDQARTTGYLSMELIDGLSLRGLLRARGPLPMTAAARIAQILCQTLQIVHDAGVVHRDVKSENVMVTREGRVVVMDFGIARTMGSTTLTAADAVLGTVSYMSPEQATSSHVEPPADVYSAGVVAYELLTGRVPFQADDVMALFFQIFQEDPPHPCDLRKDIPRELAEVVLQAMAKEPAQRFGSAHGLAAALEPFTGDADLPPLAELLGTRSGLSRLQSRRPVRAERRVAAQPREDVTALLREYQRVGGAVTDERAFLRYMLERATRAPDPNLVRLLESTLNRARVATGEFRAAEVDLDGEGEEE